MVVLAIASTGVLVDGSSALATERAAAQVSLHLPGNVYPTGAALWHTFVLPSDGSGFSGWRLESRVGSRSWARVESVKRHGAEFAVRIPALSMSKLHPKPVTYRVTGTRTVVVPVSSGPSASPTPSSTPSPAIGGATVIRSVHTGPFTVRYENPRTYTGYRKNLYDAAKKWCPAMTIRISSAQERTATGATSVAYTWMSQRQVVVRPGLSSFDYWGTMPHECAHIRQGDAYTSRSTGMLDYSRLQRDMARIYGGGLALGMEYNADCTASVWFGHHRGGAYGGPCSTPRQIWAAKRIGHGRRA